MTNAYDKIEFRGRTYDRITARGHEHGEYCLGKLVKAEGPVNVPIWQGPFSTVEPKSGGTHAESGAEDTDHGLGCTWHQTAWAFRLAGWFSSVRTPDQGSWKTHIHNVQLGNLRLSDAAAVQARNYRDYDDAGLVGNDRDLMTDVDPLVPFRYRLGSVNIERVAEEFRKTKGHKSLSGVKHIQRTLNLKRHETLLVDGIAGLHTRRALARWELANGGDGDGIPGALLWLLGASQFEVD